MSGHDLERTAKEQAEAIAAIAVREGSRREGIAQKLATYLQSIGINPNEIP